MNEIQQSSYAARMLKRKTWDAVIQKWKQSGLTLKTFCEEQQIKETHLKYWCYPLYNTASIKVLQEPSNNYKQKPQFIPIALSTSSNMQSDNSADEDQIELVIEKTYCIRLKKHFDEQQLLRLIQLLKGQAHVNACS